MTLSKTWTSLVLVHSVSSHYSPYTTDLTKFSTKVHVKATCSRNEEPWWKGKIQKLNMQTRLLVQRDCNCEKAMKSKGNREWNEVIEAWKWQIRLKNTNQVYNRNPSSRKDEAGKEWWNRQVTRFLLKLKTVTAKSEDSETQPVVARLFEGIQVYEGRLFHKAGA